MTVTVPTSEQLKEVAEDLGLALEEGDVASFLGLLAPNIGAYNLLDAMPDELRK